jgi:hypothetical protein
MFGLELILRFSKIVSAFGNSVRMCVDVLCGAPDRVLMDDRSGATPPPLGLGLGPQ